MADGNSPRVLPDLSARMAEMEAMMARLAAENAALRAAATSPLANIRYQVNDGVTKGKDGKPDKQQAGGISIFVNSKYPAVMYADQWLKLLDFMGYQAPDGIKGTDRDLRHFIDQHKSRLSWKAPKG